MKFRRQRRDELNVNLTPLIDVVFLLLIFFMVSTTFTRETRLAVDLPEATGVAAPPHPRRHPIMVEHRGNYRVNGQGLVDNRLRTLQAAIYEVSEGDTTLPLLISADADATHRAVVRAMDAAGQMGFAQLGIATLQPAPDAG